MSLGRNRVTVQMPRKLAVLVLGCALLCGGAWFGLRLLADDGHAIADGAGRKARAAIGPAFLGPDSRPESRAESRGPTQPLTLTPKDGAIRGRVVDHGEIPVNHAKVKVELRVAPGERNFALVSKFSETVSVDDEGRFQLVVPGGGVYRVVAEASGFAPAIKSGVKPGDEIELVVDVGAMIRGTVVDKQNQRVVADTEIILFVEGSELRKTKSDAQGGFELTELPSGKVIVSAFHPEFVPQPSIERTLEPGQNLALPIELDAGKSIRGQVLSADEQRPIEGAQITVRRKKVKSDSSGRFLVRGLEAEQQQLEVAAEGFQANQREVNLAGSRQEALAEILLQRGATIRGKVTSDSGEPLAGVEIKLYQSWGGDWLEEDWSMRHLDLKTGEDGSFKMTGIPPREWAQLAVRARKEGYPESYEKGLKLRKVDDEAFVVITMKRGALISGRVVDQENRPVVGARVELRQRNTYDYWYWQGNGDDRTKIAGTNSDGEFLFDTLTAAKYNITVQARGFSTGYKNDIDVSTGGQSTGNMITVEAGKPLKGYVVDADEKPVPGANVQVWTQKGSGHAVADPEGKFSIECMPTGPYEVWASAPGYAGTNLQKQVADPERGLRILLKKQATLSGTIVDAVTKKPIPTARVVLSTEDPRRGGQQRVAFDNYQQEKDGKFRAQAEAGVYRLEVFAAGYVRYRKEGVALEAGKDPEPLVVEMKKGGAIEGTVRKSNGQPESWVTIYSAKDDGVAPYGSSVQSEADGYFYVGDLDAGTYKLAFQQGGASILVQSGVYVNGDKPTFVDVQLETGINLLVDIVAERPRDDQEVVAGASTNETDGSTPPPPQQRPFRPRIRAWVESVDGALLGFNWEWTGVEETCKPQTRRDLWVPRQPRSTVVAQDLSPGRYVLRVTCPGFEDFARPLQLSSGGRPRVKAELVPLPKDLRPAGVYDSNTRQRMHRWTDGNGVSRTVYYEDDG